MDNFLRQQGSEVASIRQLFASLMDALKWLGNLFLLTEEEKQNAGIYTGDPYSK